MDQISFIPALLRLIYGMKTTVKENAEVPFVTRMMVVCKSMQGKLQAYSVLMFCKRTAEQNHFI